MLLSQRFDGARTYTGSFTTRLGWGAGLITTTTLPMTFPGQPPSGLGGELRLRLRRRAASMELKSCLSLALASLLAARVIGDGWAPFLIALLVLLAAGPVDVRGAAPRTRSDQGSGRGAAGAAAGTSCDGDMIIVAGRAARLLYERLARLSHVQD